MLLRSLGAICSFSLLVHGIPGLRAAELTASNGANPDNFGGSVVVFGTTAIIGAQLADNGPVSNHGYAYGFRGLDIATGTVTQNFRLVPSDGQPEDGFGSTVGLSGNIALVGAYPHTVGGISGRGITYVYRGLDTAGGDVTENARLTASDGATNDFFGTAVSISGTMGLIGAGSDDFGSSMNRGSAYLFRNLDTVTGTVTESTKLTASDGAAGDTFGISTSLSGTIGVVGAYADDVGSNANQGSAYLYRNLDTAGATATQNAKLVASDGTGGDLFAYSVSVSGTNALAGATGADVGANANQGAAYLFRNLDTAAGTVNQQAKLTASDGVSDDNFGISVSISGTNGLVGASGDDTGSNSLQGAAYLYQNLNSASGTITETVKIVASNGMADDLFGQSVSIDGDQFVIGATKGDGVTTNTGKGYSGSVSSITTLDAGNASRTIDRISFISKTDWIVGQSTDANQVTLTAGDSANVTAPGKAVSIGANAGSDNNTLIVEGTLTANEVRVGAVGNTGNSLEIRGAGSVSGTITNQGSVTFAPTGTATHSSTIEGSGYVVKSGSGTLILTASNNYSGGTNLLSGTLVAEHNSALGSGSVNVSGGTFLVKAGVTVSNAVVLAGGQYNREFGAGASLAGGKAVSNLSGGIATAAEILEGTSGGVSTVTTSFAEDASALNDASRFSDVFALSGVHLVNGLTGETSIFVLELTVAGVTGSSILGWLDPESNLWVNAVEGNFGGLANFVGDRAYNPSTDFALGNYGVDTANGKVWAVINHNSEFAAVPEPSSLILLVLGAAFFVRRSRTDS